MTHWAPAEDFGVRDPRGKHKLSARSDQRKRQPSGYLSSCRAMTTRWIWLVPS